MPLRYQFLLSGLLTLLFKLGAFLADRPLAWWLAAVISLVLVFGGDLLWELALDGDNSGDDGSGD